MGMAPISCEYPHLKLKRPGPILNLASKDSARLCSFVNFESEDGALISLVILTIFVVHWHEDCCGTCWLHYTLNTITLCRA